MPVQVLGRDSFDAMTQPKQLSPVCVNTINNRTITKSHPYVTSNAPTLKKNLFGDSDPQGEALPLSDMTPGWEEGGVNNPFEDNELDSRRFSNLTVTKSTPLIKRLPGHFELVGQEDSIFKAREPELEATYMMPEPKATPVPEPQSPKAFRPSETFCVRIPPAECFTPVKGVPLATATPRSLKRPGKSKKHRRSITHTINEDEANASMLERPTVEDEENMSILESPEGQDQPEPRNLQQDLAIQPVQQDDKVHVVNSQTYRLQPENSKLQPKSELKLQQEDLQHMRHDSLEDKYSGLQQLQRDSPEDQDIQRDSLEDQLQIETPQAESNLQQDSVLRHEEPELQPDVRMQQEIQKEISNQNLDLQRYEESYKEYYEEETKPDQQYKLSDDQYAEYKDAETNFLDEPQIQQDCEQQSHKTDLRTPNCLQEAPKDHGQQDGSEMTPENSPNLSPDSPGMSLGDLMPTPRKTKDESVLQPQPTLKLEDLVSRHRSYLADDADLSMTDLTTSRKDKSKRSPKRRWVFKLYNRYLYKLSKYV